MFFGNLKGAICMFKLVFGIWNWIIGVVFRYRVQVLIETGFRWHESGVVGVLVMTMVI